MSRKRKVSTDRGGEVVLPVRSVEVRWRWERSGERGKATAAVTQSVRTMCTSIMMK